jgi:hypothetical protein
MPIHGKTGGAWETVTEPSAKSGGTWRDGGSTTDGVEAVYVKVGGAWRMAWPLKTSVTTISVFATTFGGPATGNITLQTDGRIKKWGDGLSTTYDDFADNAPDTDKGGAADTLFQYKWETNPDTPDTVPVAASTWTDLTADAVWSETRSTAGFDQATFTLHIRAKDAPNSEISFDVTVSGEWTF